jgi:hypothetical protein
VATLGVVMILGLLMTVALTGTFGTSAPQHGTTIPGSPATTIPTSPASGASLAAQRACEADFQALTTAVEDYRALNGSLPPAGHAWATSAANGGPFMQSWPGDSQHFDFAWNGSTLEVVPVHGRPSRGSAGVGHPASGCYSAR